MYADSTATSLIFSSDGHRGVITSHSSFENWKHEGIGDRMPVYMTTSFDDSSSVVERLLQTPHQGHLLFRPHDKLLSCFCTAQKSCVSRSKRRSSNSVKSTWKSIWPMTWFSSLPRCCAAARESPSMPGWPR